MKQYSTYEKQLILNKVARKFTQGRSDSLTKNECKQLPSRIKDSTNMKLSHSTIRRCFGYSKTGKNHLPGISEKSLNILCEYLGYESISDFLNDQNVLPTGNMVIIRELEYSHEYFKLEIRIGEDLTFLTQIPNPLKWNNNLDWYFDEYLFEPWMVGEEDCVEEINEYGQRLFQLLFDNEDSKASLLRKCVLKFGVDNITFKIVSNSAGFDDILWETLYDSESGQPFLLQGANFIRSSEKESEYVGSTAESQNLRMLIVTSRNSWQGDVDYRSIQRPLIKAIRASNLKIEYDILRPGTFESLSKHMNSADSKKYHIVHLDVHGTVKTYAELMDEKAKGHLHFSPKAFQTGSFNQQYGKPNLKPYKGYKSFLYFEHDEEEKMLPYEPEVLANLFQANQVPMCILNSCHSAKASSFGRQSIARAFLNSGVQMVVAMRYSISVSAALIWVETFYEKLLKKGQSVEKSVSLAARELSNRKTRKSYLAYDVDLEDWMLPVIFSNQKVDLNITKSNSNEDSEEEPSKEESIGLPEFCGRDLDIHRIEKLLIKGKGISLHGIKGVGKTALLDELKIWWIKSKLFNRVVSISISSLGNADLLFWIMKELGIYKMGENSEMQKYNRLRSYFNKTNEQFLIILDHWDYDNFEKDWLENRELVLFLIKFQNIKIVLSSRFPISDDDLISFFEYRLRPLSEFSAHDLAKKLMKKHKLNFQHYLDLNNGEDLKELLRLTGYQPNVISELIGELKENTIQNIKLKYFGDFIL